MVFGQPQLLKRCRRFFAFVLMMALYKLPAIDDYWSTKQLFHGGWARAIIPSRRRFKAILAFFKIVYCFNEEAEDRLKKVRYLYEQMQKRFKTPFQPGQCVSVDERVIPSKARFTFRQYLLKKPVKWGTKVWALCNSGTGFCYAFAI